MANSIHAINSTSLQTTFPVVRMEIRLKDMLRTTGGKGLQKGGIRMLVALLQGWRGMAVVCMLANMVVGMAVMCMLVDMVVLMAVVYMLVNMVVRRVAEERRGRRRTRIKRRATDSWQLCKLEEAREDKDGMELHGPGHWNIENAAMIDD